MFSDECFLKGNKSNTKNRLSLILHLVISRAYSTIIFHAVNYIKFLQLYLPPILVPVVKLKKQYIYKFSKRLNYEKQEEKIHKIVQT